MLNKADALRIVIEAGRAARVLATRPSATAIGLRLAVDAVADADIPPFEKSSMDGYAVRAADVATAPVRLRVLGAVHAGEIAAGPALPGGAWKIMTGAALPVGADAVVMVEESEALPATGEVLLRKAARPWQNVCRRGEDARAGETVVPAGTTIDAAAAGLLASVGLDPVPVFAPPSICVIPTGDELVPAAGPPPPPGSIRESNGVLLEAAVRGLSPALSAFRPGVARDDRASLDRFLDVGLAHDVLILSGGVSMGDLDLVGAALKERGMEVLIEKVSIKPGKPLLFGLVRRPDGGTATVFGLPGNPVSSFATCELFVRPYLLARLGDPTPEPEEITAILAHDRPLKIIPRTQHLPATLEVDAGRVLVRPLPWNGSADLRGLVDASAFVVVPPDGAPPSPGDLVVVHRLAHRPLRAPHRRAGRS
jgi:molybdopterin molybdotransferase